MANTLEPAMTWMPAWPLCNAEEFSSDRLGLFSTSKPSTELAENVRKLAVRLALLFSTSSSVLPARQREVLHGHEVGVVQGDHRRDGQRIGRG